MTIPRERHPRKGKETKQPKKDSSSDQDPGLGSERCSPEHWKALATPTDAHGSLSRVGSVRGSCPWPYRAAQSVGTKGPHSFKYQQTSCGATRKRSPPSCPDCSTPTVSRSVTDSQHENGPRQTGRIAAGQREVPASRRKRITAGQTVIRMAESAQIASHVPGKGSTPAERTPSKPGQRVRTPTRQFRKPNH